jgi:hypothetical protein
VKEDIHETPFMSIHLSIEHISSTLPLFEFGVFDMLSILNSIYIFDIKFNLNLHHGQIIIYLSIYDLLWYGERKR